MLIAAAMKHTTTKTKTVKPVAATIRVIKGDDLKQVTGGIIQNMK